MCNVVVQFSMGGEVNSRDARRKRWLGFCTLPDKNSVAAYHRKHLIVLIQPGTMHSPHKCEESKIEAVCATVGAGK